MLCGQALQAGLPEPLDRELVLGFPFTSWVASGQLLSDSQSLHGQVCGMKTMVLIMWAVERVGKWDGSTEQGLSSEQGGFQRCRQGPVWPAAWPGPSRSDSELSFPSLEMT